MTRATFCTAIGRLAATVLLVASASPAFGQSGQVVQLPRLPTKEGTSVTATGSIAIDKDGVEKGTLANPHIVGCVNASNVRSDCAGAANTGSGGDASAANQTSTQAAPGSASAKATAVQASDGTPLASKAQQTSQLTAEQAIALVNGTPTDPANCAIDATPASQLAEIKCSITKLTALATAITAMQAQLHADLITATPAGTATIGGVNIAGGGLGTLSSPMRTDPSGTTRQPIDSVVGLLATNRSQLIGTSSVTVSSANASRRGWLIQVQGAASNTCYVNDRGGAATADQNSVQFGGGGAYQTPEGHVTPAAIAIICSASSVPVHFEEW